MLSFNVKARFIGLMYVTFFWFNLYRTLGRRFIFFIISLSYSSLFGVSKGNGRLFKYKIFFSKDIL